MNDVVFSVENLGKRYRILHQAEKRGRRTLRDLIAERFASAFKSRSDTHAPKDGSSPDAATSEDFWALKDVSFEVKQGEVVGIIGRNGAGKSTLLKILSRITEPTEGRVEITGRVASLLEVGTGFHPELTGRENIYLNGAILGMAKLEIKRKFDEIVAFAEVERFLDTPVKRYSSGMYVRLAFAVAAHLEPEILIVDEVLAVGDASFQQKCIGKMQNVSKSGRTVVFVSHNMQAVVALCHTAIWLQGGKLLEVGQSRNLVGKYMEKHSTEGLDNSVPLIQRPRSGSGAARFTNLTIVPLRTSGRETDQLTPGASVRLDLEIQSERILRSANVAVTIYDTNSYRLIDVNTALKGEFLSLMPGETAKVSFVVEELLLKPGRYTVELWLGRGGIEDVDFIRDAGVLEVHDDVAKASHTETFPGIYQCRFSHQISKSCNEEIFEASKAGHP